MNQQLWNDLIEQSKQDWLIGWEAQAILNLTNQKIIQLKQLQTKKELPLNILLAETNPRSFIASFFASIITNNYIFLCNPDWQKSEWQQVFELVDPDLIWIENKIKLLHEWQKQSTKNQNLDNPKNIFQSKIKTSLSTPNNSSLIMIPTGGSSGKIRFAIHTWSTLTASVQGFCQYFQIKTINSCCLLPLYHVSGLMQLMRSFLTKGKLIIFPYQNLKQGKQPNIDLEEFFVSLVPTQLQFLLQSNPHWLASFQTVLLGGAPAWQSLLDRARKYRIALAPSYGMTETASQIVTLQPKDFLAGNNSNGQVLPHAQVTIIDDNQQLLINGKIGQIFIKSNSLSWGYYPQFNPNQILNTDDLGWFDKQGYLHIIGRSSQKIITGGENVFPLEVEAAILATGLVKDVCVIGLPDCHWGQVVTAVYVPSKLDVSEKLIQQKLQQQLSKYKHPKLWFSVDCLPRNQQGKINYQQILEIVVIADLAVQRKIM
ncbi:o-succinylbenzoate--CoA ligase [Stanieria cyanosphaera PCC 7437]|uniref:O-succinylbenzoate--CoA ligase n=1 Tax=Stanieria cyanosphaera (strain ATCC 29371 / PCC 7437) TaxID=111780 RepID=K9XYT3_STAC7|nr:2-succinylbenzoate--CoA ligase [Stanieria cyanosphaera]AFZ37673.1 o-succinylbenzoate--CoA ligase [Stanieria cyanosphaera PCC 7437]